VDGVQALEMVTAKNMASKRWLKMRIAWQMKCYYKEKGDIVNDNDDYELMMWCYLVAHLVVFLLALVGIAGLAGYLWGML